MIRSLIRDVLCLYIGFRLIAAGIYQESIPFGTMIIFGVILFFFTIWFLLEKIGLLPKMTG